MVREIHNHEQEIHVAFIPPEKWWHRAKWCLLKEYTSHNSKVTATKDFVTDGATIPWFLRWRFSPTGKYFGAAIVHDYILNTTGDWRWANVEFNNELKALDISTSERYVMVFFVELWARVKTLLGMKVKA